MTRTAVHSRRLDSSLPSDTVDAELESPDDVATANFINAHESLTSRQYVVYSATFQVPAFYFIIHDSSAFRNNLRLIYSEIDS